MHALWKSVTTDGPQRLIQLLQQEKKKKTQIQPARVSLTPATGLEIAA